MIEPEIVVLGAGLAGLGAAFQLNRHGIKTIIFDKENTIGGLCRSIKKDSFLFDIGPHIVFSPPSEIENLVSSLLDNDEVYIHESMLYHHQIGGKYIRAPYQAHLYGLPRKDIILSLLDFILARARDEKKADNYADFFKSVLGNTIYKNFFLPYDNKRLRYTPYLLDAEWVKHRVTTPSLLEIVRGAIKDTGSSIGDNASFRYPHQGGIQNFTNSLADRLFPNQIHLNKEVYKINPAAKKIEFKDGSTQHYEKLLSSLPIPDIIEMIEGIPDDIKMISRNEIKYTSGYVINLGVNREDVSPYRIIRYHEPDIIFYRVTVQSNIASYSSLPGHSILCSEISYHPERFPLSREEAIMKTINDLKKVGLLRSESEIITQNVTDLKYCHLIFQRNFEHHLDRVLNYLHQNDIYSFGRWGGWQYLLMGPSILSGIKVVDKLLKEMKSRRVFDLAVA